MRKTKRINSFTVLRELLPILEAAEKDAYSIGGGVDKKGERNQKVGSIGEQRGCSLLCMSSI